MTRRDEQAREYAAEAHEVPNNDAKRSARIADRLCILAALGAGPAGQSELAARTGLSIAQVSKRLGELRRDGAIERDGECRSASGGREARYRRVA